MFGLTTSQGFGYRAVGVEENHKGMCRWLWVWQSLTLKCVCHGFLSEKHSLQYVGNESINSVGEDMVEQICQNSKTECLAGRPYPRITREN